jgi:hypothetical protein
MIVFAVLLYVLYRSKKFWKIIVASMICLSIANYVAAYASIYKSYHTDREQIPLYEQADEYLSQLDGNILLVLNSDQSIQPYFDSYVKRQLYVDTLRTLVFTDYFEDGVLDLETEKLPQERPYGGISWNLSEVDYIMTFGEVQVENAEQIDGFVLETEGMKLYKNLDSSKVYITCNYLDVLTEDEKKTLIQVNLNDETNVK